MTFKSRLSAPNTSDKYWRHTSIGGLNECLLIKNGSVLPNCVGYAWGRAYEILGSKPKLSKGNAENWYNYNDGYPRGNTPSLGAIAVWQKGSTLSGSDGAGHVAVVEKINSSTQIVTSESGYGSATTFWTKTRNKGSDGNWGAGSGYKFLGFIYIDSSSTSSTNSNSTNKITSTTANHNLPTLRQGMKSDTVKALQLLLSGYGYSAGKADGIFGKLTYNALKSYQNDKNLVADGECGKVTWAILLGIL